MSNSIKNWLKSSKDYNIGVALYNAHGSNDAIKKMFAQGESAYRLQRLVTELQVLSKTIDIDNPIVVEPKYEPVNVHSIQLPENAVPPEIDKYIGEWKPLLMQRNHLRARLRDADNDIERGKMAHQILVLQDQLEAIWERRDYELRTGEAMPEVKKREPVTDPKKLQRHVLNLRTYITKTKKTVADNPENDKATKRLAQLERELSEALKQMEG